MKTSLLRIGLESNEIRNSSTKDAFNSLTMDRCDEDDVLLVIQNPFVRRIEDALLLLTGVLCERGRINNERSELPK